MANGTYPQNPAEWQLAIQDSIGVGRIEGQEAYQAGQFPYDELGQWIRRGLQSRFRAGPAEEYQRVGGLGLRGWRRAFLAGI